MDDHRCGRVRRKGDQLIGESGERGQVGQQSLQLREALLEEHGVPSERQLHTVLDIGKQNLKRKIEN